MAFSGYPDADRALTEMCRVLRPGGRLTMIDVNYPADGNWIGTALTNWAKRAGDLIRDIPRALDEHGFTSTDTAIGGCGSVHLYIAQKASQTRCI